MKQPEREELIRIAGAIAGASASTEARFVDIADRLESSIGMMAALVTTFDTLSEELTGTNLRTATVELSQIAARVSALAAAQNRATQSLKQLHALTTVIQQRTSRMMKSLIGVGMLATNAKVAVAHIDEKSPELVSFAMEIARTLQLAVASLDRFASENADVGRALSAALAAQAALDRDQEAVVRAIPMQLGKSVAAIGERSKRAADTAAAVRRDSRRVGEHIGAVVLSLQIGDATRQRIEHVDTALGMLAQECAGPGAWGQRVPVGPLCSLQSAQLRDAADRLDPEIRRIAASLSDLAGDAGEILSRGNMAFGASGGRQGSFLGELEEDVAKVDRLLADFQTARLEADSVASAVSQGTARLATHIGSVRSLEADIRIMGLNMSFKCSRLGAAGRTLSVIAQELRVHAREIAGEANEVMKDLARISETTQALVGQVHEEEVSDIAASMAHSLQHLRTTGESLATALDALRRDAGIVAGLLAETVTRAGEHEEISRELRKSAAELDRGAREAAAEPFAASPAADELLDRMMQSYTMESERMILVRHAPWISYKANDPPTNDPDDFFL